MGVLCRLAPTLLKIEAASPRLVKWQLALFLVGSWGMIAHFWIGEWTGMSWSAILVWAVALLQLWNFRAAFRRSKRDRWARWFVASSLVYFALAATLGMILALGKAYDFRPSFLAESYLANVFAHAHLAGVGWVGFMVFGFQLKLVPTTLVGQRSVPTRFLLLQVGTLGVVAGFFAGWSVFPFALLLAVACGWHAYGPARALVRGKAREWELGPLVLLTGAAVLGVVLSLGWPETGDPARGRVELAYGLLGLVGFEVLTVTTVAFKIFPMWVWKERFQQDFGKRPVPGMKELHIEWLRRFGNVAGLAGAPITVAAIVLENEAGLAVGTGLLLAAFALFIINLARVARWSFFVLEYRPTEEDWRKYEDMFGR